MGAMLVLLPSRIRAVDMSNDGHNLTLYFLVLAVRIAHGNPVSVRSCVIMSTNMVRSKCHLIVYLKCVRGITLDPCGIHFPQKVARFIKRNATPTFILHASLKTANTAPQGLEHTRKPLIAT